MISAKKALTFFLSSLNKLKKIDSNSNINPNTNTNSNTYKNTYINTNLAQSQNISNKITYKTDFKRTLNCSIGINSNSISEIRNFEFQNKLKKQTIYKKDIANNKYTKVHKVINYANNKNFFNEYIVCIPVKKI